MKNNLTNIQLFTFLCLLLVLSCQDKGEDILPTQEITLLTLTTPTDENFSEYERWVLITDLEGITLSLKQIKENSTETFMTTQPFNGLINVTFLSVSLEPNNTNYNLSTYTEINVGEVWDYPNSSVPATNFDGTSEVNINNINRNNTYNALGLITASSARGEVLTSYNSNSDYSWDSKLSIYVNNNPVPILITVNDGISSPSFMWLNDAIPGSSYTFDFQKDFQPMDEILEFSFQEVSTLGMEIKAYENYKILEQPFNRPRRDGYMMSMFFDFDGGAKSFKMGYLNDFNYYSTYLTLTYPNKSVTYFKIGSPPTMFTKALFDSDFEVLSSELTNFEFTSSGDFDYLSGYWRSDIANNEENIGWRVYYPIDKSKNKILIEFPDGIKDKYPFLSLDNVGYVNANFVDNIDNKPYQFFIENTFKKQDQLVLLEQYWLKK